MARLQPNFRYEGLRPYAYVTGVHPYVTGGGTILASRSFIDSKRPLIEPLCVG